MAPHAECGRASNDRAIDRIAARASHCTTIEIDEQTKLPIVRAAINDRPIRIALDTGSSIAALAKRTFAVGRIALVGPDRGQVDVTPQLDLVVDGGWPAIHIALELGSIETEFDAAGIDGLVPPQALLEPGRAVVLDLHGHRLFSVAVDEIAGLEWSDEQTMVLSDQQPNACHGTAPSEESGKYVLRAARDARSATLLLDTGASETELYAAAVPPDHVAVPAWTGALRVGMSKNKVTLRSRIRGDTTCSSTHVDGAIGDDLLDDCVIVLTSDRAIVRCPSDVDGAGTDPPVQRGATASSRPFTPPSQLDGFEIGGVFDGSFYDPNVALRAQYKQPCSQPTSERDDDLYEARTFLASACSRAGVPRFPMGTSVVALVEPGERIRAFGWVGGTYFKDKVALPVAIGDPLAAALAAFGEPVRRFRASRKLRVLDYGRFAVLSDRDRVAGFVFGKMPTDPIAVGWHQFADAYDHAPRVARPPAAGVSADECRALRRQRVAMVGDNADEDSASLAASGAIDTVTDDCRIAITPAMAACLRRAQTREAWIACDVPADSTLR